MMVRWLFAEVEAVIAYLHTLWTPEQLATQQNITSQYAPQEGGDDGS